MYINIQIWFFHENWKKLPRHTVHTHIIYMCLFESCSYLTLTKWSFICRCSTKKNLFFINELMNSAYFPLFVLFLLQTLSQSWFVNKLVNLITRAHSWKCWKNILCVSFRLAADTVKKSIKVIKLFEPLSVRTYYSNELPNKRTMIYEDIGSFMFWGKMAPWGTPWYTIVNPRFTILGKLSKKSFKN